MQKKLTDWEKEWEKENIRLSEDEAANREFLRVETESASDSEVLRQSLRNVEQLIEDYDDNKKFVIRRPNNELIYVVPSMFIDPPTTSGSMLRRSMILHKRSKERINSLRTRLGLGDISAVARFALRFSFRIVKEAVDGAHFFVIDKYGKSKEVRFGALSGFQANAREPVSDGPPADIQTIPSTAAGASASSQRAQKRPVPARRVPVKV